MIIKSNYPIEKIRNQFPALKRIIKTKPIAYFDGPSGTQCVQTSIDAMMNYFHDGSSNLGGNYPTSLESEQIVLEARQAVADLVGAKTNEVAFGLNTTSLAFAVSRALGRFWQKGEIVVSEIDHRANVDPWLTIAEDKNITVHWLRMDPEKYVLKLDNLDTIINNKTKAVAIVHASNGLGTINDVKKIAAQAKSVGALVVVDAVHSAPHILIDRDQLQADIIFGSAYKFFGPHLGFVVIKEELFQKIDPYKVTASPSHYPDNLETGTQSFEAIAGLPPAIDFIASFGSGNTRREKIISAFDIIKSYEDNLADKLRASLVQIPGIILYQAMNTVPKTPTVAFRIEGISPDKAVKYIAEEHSVFLGNGHFYAQTIGDILDINSSGGWLRAGIAPYNTEEEIDRLIIGIKELILNIN